MANKKKPEVIPDKKTILSMVEEYQKLKIQEKQITDRKKLLADTIKLYAENKGTKSSEGSFYCESDKFVFGSQCKKSIKLDEAKTLKFIESKGKLLEDCIELKPVIDEKSLENHFATGDITSKELESLTDVKITMAISVEAKEELPEVQQTSAIAASKKKPVLKKKGGK